MKTIKVWDIFIRVFHWSLITAIILQFITAESLKNEIQQIISGEWEGFKVEINTEGITFIGIFALGVLTALSPCSIALLVAMISYVSTQLKEEKGTQGI